MAYTVGDAQVPVTPDFRNFHTAIDEEVDSMEAKFAAAGDSSGKKFGDAFGAQVKASFADLPDATVKAGADTTKLDADLDAATKDRTATVRENADTTAATAQLAELQRKIDVLKAQKAGIKVTLDASSLDVSIAKAEAELDALTKRSYTVKLKAVADTSAVKMVDELLSPAVLGAAGLATALGPTAAAAALGVAGIGVAFGAAASDAGAFGIIAKGMFTDVTTAQKALTTAQGAYAKATTPAARAKALAAEKAATDGLTSSEKQLLVQVNSLESGWKKLTTAEQPFVESALTPWLQTATSGMKLLRPLMDDGATAVQLLGTDADAAIKSPFWTTFADTLGATGQDALTAFGTAAGKVGDGLAHLFVTFAPDIDKILPLVDDVATAFDHWATSVTSGGLDDFLTKTFTPANVAALAADGRDLATFVENVAKGSQDMSPLAFVGLGNVLDVMGRLTPAEIEAVTGLFLAVKTIGTVTSAVNSVSNFLTQAKSAAGKVAGLFGTTADAAAEGTASGEAAGEAAGVAFSAAFAEAAEAGMPKAFLAIEAGDSVEAKALGAALGEDAAPAFTTETAAEREAAGKTVVGGSVVKEGEEGDGNAAKAPAGESAGSKIGKIGNAAASASVVLPIAAAAEAALPAPDVTWLNSWAPYEKIFTNDLPEAWSISYQAFQVEFAGKLTAFFTETVPHLFTGQIPMGWDAAYQGFENGFGSPVAAWFTNSLPHFFSSSGSVLTSAGSEMGGGLEKGWNATEGALSTAFGASKNWAARALSTASSWLTGAGHDASSGLVRAWDATQATVTSDFGKARTWVLSPFAAAGSWLGGAGGEASSGFRKAWNATSGTVSGDAAKARSWVTGPFAAAGSWLISAGTAVMGGFLSSLESEYTDVQNFVTGIGSWIADHKGPPSEDYKLLQPAGAAIMGGFGAALQSGFAGSVQPVVSGTAAAVLAGMASAQSAASLAALGVPSVSAGARLPGVSSPLAAGPLQLQLQLSYAGSGNQLTDALVGALRADIQGSAGGDVQAHLGRGKVRA